MQQIVKATTSSNLLGWRDFARGILVASITAVLTVVENSFELGQFTISWTNIWHTASLASISYLIKNLFTPPTTTITPPPNATSVTVDIPAPGKSLTTNVKS